MLIVEWMGHKQGSRAVSVTLDEPKKRIVLTEDGKTVRVIDLSRLDASQHTVRVTWSAERTTKIAMLSIPHVYDLVGLYYIDFGLFTIIHFCSIILTLFRKCQAYVSDYVHH